MVRLPSAAKRISPLKRGIYYFWITKVCRRAFHMSSYVSPGLHVEVSCDVTGGFVRLCVDDRHEAIVRFVTRRTNLLTS